MIKISYRLLWDAFSIKYHHAQTKTQIQRKETRLELKSPEAFHQNRRVRETPLTAPRCWGLAAVPALCHQGAVCVRPRRRKVSCRAAASSMESLAESYSARRFLLKQPERSLLESCMKAWLSASLWLTHTQTQTQTQTDTHTHKYTHRHTDIHMWLWHSCLFVLLKTSGVKRMWLNKHALQQWVYMCVCVQQAERVQTNT